MIQKEIWKYKQYIF